MTLVNQGPKTVWAISLGKYQNFRNSLENISNSKFLSGKLRLPIHTREVGKSNLFHGGLISQASFSPGNFLGWIQLRYWGRVSYIVFAELFSDLVVTTNNFIVFDQVNFKVFCYLFWQKWFDSFPKCFIINYNLSIKIAIKILFLISQKTDNVFTLFILGFLSISLFVFKNLFLKRDLLMISLFNVLFIKGDWLVLTYIFLNGACLSRVIFTEGLFKLKKCHKAVDFVSYTLSGIFSHLRFH